MSVKFQFEASAAEELLMKDSFTKLCTVLFPVEAARAPKVMHYERHADDHTLIFLCNASIHQSRVTPPRPMRINGVMTRKWSRVQCAEFPVVEVEEVVEQLHQMGYNAFTTVVNEKTSLYISWDEQCMTAVPEEPMEQ